MTVAIIGIDCATEPKKVGLALGYFKKNKPKPWIVCVTHGGEQEPANKIQSWIDAHDGATLLAWDAPLGWPSLLGKTLTSHRAGERIAEPANMMFRRDTDRIVKVVTGKQPLDVGADRIARTARCALMLLEVLRQRTGQKMPLAWEPFTDNCTRAIEVYPAGTLAVLYEDRVPSYKKKGDHKARQEILDKLRENIDFKVEQSLLKKNADALDAAVCVLAGADFLRGECIKPIDIELAKKEGWIWVRKSSHDSAAGGQNEPPGIVQCYVEGGRRSLR
jgi:predicted RNase H-like nuclease